MKTSWERTAVAATAATTLGLLAAPPLGEVAGIPGGIAAVLAGLALGGLVFHRLPASVDGTASRRPWTAAAWALLALLTIVQTGRLSVYMSDRSGDWWLTTQNEFWSRHECMTAYFYAADLDRQGVANVYDEDLYPGLNPDAVPHPTVEHLRADDPYQYPPQFLLLPRLAIALSGDFDRIRPVWFLVQALFVLGVAFLFARHVGGSAGAAAAWLVPLVWVSVPTLQNFQYGQFHLTTIALAVAAFLAFEDRRHALGGGLLAAAVLAKGFPALLVLPLVFRKRWRDLAWTGGWATALTAAAWAVIGTGPFVAFFTYHLPRLRNAAAFAFDRAWPEFADALLAGNVSPYAAVRKLDALHVPGMTTDMAGLVQTGFVAALIAAAVWGLRRRREDAALVWLALLNLGALTSPAAWGDYVPAGSVWLLTLLAGRSYPRSAAVPLAVAWVLCALTPGVVPIGSWQPVVPSFVLAILTTVTLIALNGWVLLRGTMPRGARR